MSDFDAREVERFRRVLFLVDRSVLDEQAANAFKDTRMENLRSFADTFGIKELEDMAPDSDTRSTSPPSRDWCSARFTRPATSLHDRLATRTPDAVK